MAKGPQDRPVRDGRRRSGRGVLAATGGAASLACGVGRAQAATISACYNNSAPHTLQYLPSGSCPSGTTKVSWNQTGPQGPQGAKGLNFRGAWSATTSYAVGDAVTSAGETWSALHANLNSKPPSANWALLAAKGAQGPQGAKGPQGAQGAPGAQGTPGYYHYNSNVDVALPKSGTQEVVGVMSPANSGPYAVTAIAEVEVLAANDGGRGAACWLTDSFVNSHSHSRSASATPRMSLLPGGGGVTFIGGITNTGDISVDVRRGDRLVLWCDDTGISASGSVLKVEMTATALSTKTNVAGRTLPQQRFVPAARRPRRQS